MEPFKGATLKALSPDETLDIADLSHDHRGRFLDLACLLILVLSRQLAHRESFDNENPIIWDS